MNVTLRQLRAFVAVADLGRFNLASGRLNLTQSAVSILIKELETELNQRLFDRHTRMVGLTGAGREFLPQARKVLDDLDLAVGNMHEFATLQRGRVTVASSIVLAATLLPPVIARFQQRYPDIMVKLTDIPEEEIRPALKRNAADLAIGTVANTDPEIRATHLMRDRLVVVCRLEHDFATRDRIAWADLAGENLIVLAQDNPLRDLVDRTLVSVASQLRPMHEVRFSTTAISMIAVGLGLAVLPENSIQLAPRVNVRAVPLDSPVVSREVSVLQHSHRTLSSAAEMLKSFFLEGARRAEPCEVQAEACNKGSGC